MIDCLDAGGHHGSSIIIAKETRNLVQAREPSNEDK